MLKIGHAGLLQHESKCCVGGWSAFWDKKLHGSDAPDPGSSPAYVQGQIQN